MAKAVNSWIELTGNDEFTTTTHGVVVIIVIAASGGYKLSGMGRENGLAALDAFTELKTVVIELSSEDPADPFKH